MQRYLRCIVMTALLWVVGINLVRGQAGRSWMAILDMEIAAEIIGIRPLVAKLSAFAVSSFMIGVDGAMCGFLRLGSREPLDFDSTLSFKIPFMVIIGGLGSLLVLVLRIHYIGCNTESL